MRCDLHVHSIASGMFTAPVLDRICRESYSEPTEVYNRLKRLGMSIVTLTDHDSIDAAQALRRHADFFLSEEVTVRMPSGTEMHLGVYGMAERDHLEIQRRRNDFIALLMYLTERKLFFSANHIFSDLRGAAMKRIFDGSNRTCLRLKRVMDRCGRRQTPAPQSLQCCWGKSRLAEAIRTPSPGWDKPIRKCLGRERLKSSSRVCVQATDACRASTAVAQS